MATRKKQPGPARKAARPPVINLKATEVKSTDKKSEKPSDKAPTTKDAKKPDNKTTASAKSKPDAATKPAKPADKKIEAKKPAAKKPDAQKPAKKKSAKGAIVLVSIAALLAAAGGGAWLFSKYGPTSKANAQLTSQVSELESRMDSMEKALAGAQKQISSSQQPSPQLGTITADVKKLQETFATLKTQLADEGTKLTKTDAKLTDLEKTIANVRTALDSAAKNGEGVDSAATNLKFDTLSQKLTDVEKSVAGLKSGVEQKLAQNQTLISNLKAGNSGIADTVKQVAVLNEKFLSLSGRLDQADKQAQAAAKSIADLKAAQERLAKAPAANPTADLARSFTLLRAAINQGKPFASELDKVAEIAPQESALDALRPFAADGVPTMTGLAKTLAGIAAPAPVKPQSGQDQQDTGVWNSLTGKLSTLVKVTKVGETDWKATRQKALDLLKIGQLASAVETLDLAGTDLPEAAMEWKKLAKNKLVADKAVNALSDKIIARLRAGTQ